MARLLNMEKNALNVTLQKQVNHKMLNATLRHWLYKGFRKDTRFNDMNYIKMAIKDNNTHFS